jgi:hypothetical protein
VPSQFERVYATRPLFLKLARGAKDKEHVNFNCADASATAELSSCECEALIWGPLMRTPAF